MMIDQTQSPVQFESDDDILEIITQAPTRSTAGKPSVRVRIQPRWATRSALEPVVLCLPEGSSQPIDDGGIVGTVMLVSTPSGSLVVHVNLKYRHNDVYNNLQGVVAQFLTEPVTTDGTTSPGLDQTGSQSKPNGISLDRGCRLRCPARGAARRVHGRCSVRGPEVCRRLGAPQEGLRMTTRATVLQQQLWSEASAPRTFVLLDGAASIDGARQAKSGGELFLPFYTGVVGQCLGDISPGLAPLGQGRSFTSAFVDGLWSGRYGVIVGSSADAKTLVEHFLTILIAVLPDRSRMFLRFYDPRILRALLDMSDDRERLELFGPVSSFVFLDDSDENVLVYRMNGSTMTTDSFSLGESA